MATLVSPGVSVSVIDESFYGSSGPGTVPFIIFATRENKTSPSGSATGTLKSNAGKLYTITSQRELVQTFGEPVFSSIGGTTQQGYALNEYGLLAAYSFLGISNRVLAMRADIDLAQLEPRDTPPVASSVDGTIWFDTSKSRVGLLRWNGTTQAWENIPVTLVTDYSQLDSNFAPLPSFPGAIGSHIMVAGDADAVVDSARFENRIFLRGSTQWELLDATNIGNKVLYRSHIRVPQPDEVLTVSISASGTGYAVGEVVTLIGLDSQGTGAKVRVLEVGLSGDVTSLELVSSGIGYTSTNLLQTATTGSGVGLELNGSLLTTGDYWIKTTSPTNGTLFAFNIFSETVGQFVEQTAPLADSRNAALALYGNNPQAGDLFVHYDYNTEDYSPNNAVGQFSLMMHNGGGIVEARGIVESPSLTVNDVISINGVDVTITGTTLQSLVAAITNAGIANIEALSSNDRLIIRNTAGTDIQLVDIVGSPIADLGLESQLAITNGYVHSNWFLVDYIASATAPSREPAAGTLWYSTDLKVDVLVNNGQGQWDEFTGEVFLQPSRPIGAAVGDLWIDTDQTPYPVISRFSGSQWIQVDNSDQTSPAGILFADARPEPTFGSDTGANNGGTAGFPDLDADAPDALLYPRDMLLFNTRYSTGNVKSWTPGYVFNGQLVGDRWVTASGNDVDGSPLMGKDAVKAMITRAMAAALTENQDIRAENVFFNLIAAPGFPELIDEMVTLNTDRKETAFIVGDTPFTLKPDGTSLQRWATNADGAASNGDKGLLTTNPYLGVYYPSGYTTNLDGQEVVVPASHIALRTIAYNDQVAYQWFAPAGFQRGLVTNAVNVGYVNDEDEFVPVELSEGQRDVLYTNNINPITFRPNRGLVVMGQKTRNPVESALDRINVARLVNFIRYQAPQIAESFLFQPNDDITRRAATVAFERFLEELVVLRGIQDFAVICDTSNNSSARIDRNELWIDLVIIPVKAVEFIYIPVRIRNTGASLTL